MAGEALGKETRETMVSIGVPTFSRVQHKHKTICDFHHIQQGVHVSCAKEPTEASGLEKICLLLLNKQLSPIPKNIPVLWFKKVNLCLKRGRISPKLSLTPLTHCSWCTMPPAPSPRSSLVTAAASASACRDNTTTKCGGPSLVPRRRFSVRT